MSKRHASHHGGAWKVAYADFVTAMMALFLVLWLASQDEKIKEAVERSFRNPFTSLTKDATGIIPKDQKNVEAVKNTTGNFDSASVVELTMLRRLSQDLSKSLQSDTDQEQDNSFKLEMIPDGVRISIFDRARRGIFEAGSAVFTTYGKWVFSTLAWGLSKNASTFLVELEGHTEHGFKPVSEERGPWEISSERANAARRALIQNGVSGGQIRKVAGFADTMPMPGRDLDDESNRRVTVLLRIRTGAGSL
jgi:chemotaxis protein MotB